jgi:hypothetical protein
VVGGVGGVGEEGVELDGIGKISTAPRAPLHAATIGDRTLFVAVGRPGVCWLFIG